MSPRAAPPAFPEALADDNDDVTWALQTALVQWKRGAAEDALEWLYRAIESAVDSGRTVRARNIQKQVNALETALRAGYHPSAPTSEAGPGAAEQSTETLEADAYVEVPVEIDSEPEEDTGLHARRSLEAAQRGSAAAADELLDDADVVEDVEEVEDIDDADVISLSKPRARYSIRSSDRFRLHRDPPASKRPEPPADDDSEPTLAPGPPEASVVPLAPPDSRRTSVPSPSPEVEPSANSEPNRGQEEEPTERSHGDDEEPTERGLEVASEREPSELVGKLLRFHEPPSDETTTRQALSLPSEPSPSSRERERLPDAEPGTSPDLSPFLGPPESGPPTEPSPESPRSTQTITRLVEPTPPAETSVPPVPPSLGEVLLSQVPGLEDLPEESQQTLVRTAAIHALDANVEVGSFALALVLKGSVSVMPAVADYTAARALPGNLVFSQGHLEQGVELRVVAGAEGAEVATWNASEFDAAIADCPWVGDDLRVVGDRFQALCGVTMGKMGEQLDDMLRALVVERCEVRRLLPGEVVVEGGKPIPGIVVLGAGRVEVVTISAEQERVLKELAPGDFLFASEILQAAPAPATARAGKGGALVLFAERKVAHELLVSVPPLLGIFAQ